MFKRHFHILASMLTICLASVSMAQVSVPSYTEAATGNTKNGIGTVPMGAVSTDISGTVTIGNTYQTVIASNTARRGCSIQNPTTATEVLLIKVGTMSAPYTVPAGSVFACAILGGAGPVTDTITVTAATAGHAFTGVVQ